MYCYSCGRPNPEPAKYCQLCGKQLLVPQEPPRPQGNSALAAAGLQAPQGSAEADRARRENEMLLRLTGTPIPLDRCHRCSALNDLTRFPFALGKEIASESNYAAVGASSVASAVTLALFGFGAIAGPRRKTTYRLLRLETQLCPLCKKKFADWAGLLKRGAYEFHPWFRGAVELGYKTIIVGDKVVR